MRERAHSISYVGCTPLGASGKTCYTRPTAGRRGSLGTENRGHNPTQSTG